MKKKEDEKKDKDKVSDMITKDSVKKEDEKEEEEKPDMRSKYAMINLIKNKLRAAGQRAPMVMAVDACEERRGSSSAELAQNRTDAKNKLKVAIGKVKQQVEKNPMGFTLQNP